MAYQHSESIYNLIPPKLSEMPRQPMHKSKYSGTQPASASSFHTKNGSSSHPAFSNLAGDAAGKVVKDSSHGDFGKRQGSYRNSPANFQKNMSKCQSTPTLAQVKRDNPDQLKPTKLKDTSHTVPIPRASEKPVMNLVTSKNFIVANAVETILAAPKKVTSSAKDYLAKEDYGKVPKYLTAVKKDIDAEYEYIRRMNEDHMESMSPPIENMDERERVALINGLKSKWESVNTEFQGATHITKIDTMGKMRRKETKEALLSSLEKDIEKLSKRNIVIDCSA
jgi:hypothetical protein